MDLQNKAAEIYARLDAREKPAVGWFTCSGNNPDKLNSISEHQRQYNASRGRGDMLMGEEDDKVTGSKDFASTVSMHERHTYFESGDVMISKSSDLHQTKGNTERITAEQYAELMQSEGSEKFAEPVESAQQ